jgi:hypothetical protein
MISDQQIAKNFKCLLRDPGQDTLCSFQPVVEWHMSQVTDFMPDRQFWDARTGHVTSLDFPVSAPVSSARAFFGMIRSRLVVFTVELLGRRPIKLSSSIISCERSSTEDEDGFRQSAINFSITYESSKNSFDRDKIDR